MKHLFHAGLVTNMMPCLSITKCSAGSRVGYSD
jgi:hypothetical protein